MAGGRPESKQIAPEDDLGDFDSADEEQELAALRAEEDDEAAVDAFHKTIEDLFEEEVGLSRAAPMRPCYVGKSCLLSVSVTLMG